jgi:SAM-dependent methyltransferase
VDVAAGADGMSSTQVVNWEERYQSGNTKWERTGLHPAFVAWRQADELRPGSILVPGAGRSADPQALMQDGFAVTVVDVAPSAVAFQQGRLGARAVVLQADLFKWEPPSPFDAIYDQTCLCALPWHMLPAYEQRLARWLRPGGVLGVMFMQTPGGGGPPFDCPVPAMRRLFPPERWAWPDMLPPLVEHPSLFKEQPALLHRR